MFEKVKAIVIDELGADEHEITREARFNEDLGCDSLDLIQMTMACEETFGLDIPDHDADQIKTVGELVAYLEQRTAAAA